MKRTLRPVRSFVLIALLLALTGATCSPPSGLNGGPDDDTFETVGNPETQAIIIESPGGLGRIAVTGTTTEFGRYLALGEATFVLGQQAGVLLDGTGVAALRAENGDQIVAEISCRVADNGIDVTFHWRDSVTFSGGSTAGNTGAFVDQRPPGLSLSQIRGRRFNDTRTVCHYCCCTECGETSCRRTCGYICCGAASGASFENCVVQPTVSLSPAKALVRAQPTDDISEQALLLESSSGVSYLAVTGVNADFGRYLALGEALLLPGTQPGVFLEGAGVAVLQADNDEQIVADVVCSVTDRGIESSFHWRDSVTFSTGSTVTNTGVFVDHRPPGLALSRVRGRTFSRDPIHCRRCFLVQNCTGSLCDVSCEVCCSVTPDVPPGCF